MFAVQAPRLRERGWGSIIPLHNPGKRPIHDKWQRHNATPPTDAEIEAWASLDPHAGIGLAVGPDRAAGIDLDFLEPAKADTARAIALEHFGHTPLIRVGLAPKTMLLYRHGGDLPSSRRLGGVELFTTSGQFVLYSIHPDTRRPYDWPVESPLDVSPAELPHINTNALTAFMAAIAPHCHRPNLARAMASSNATGNGRAAELLRAFANAPLQNPATIAAATIATAEPGDRHHSAIAAITALAIIGLGDDEIRDALRDPYAELFDSTEIDHRLHLFEQGVAWARARVGLSAADMPDAIHAIGESWSHKWR